jgi:hypothetical protein
MVSQVTTICVASAVFQIWGDKGLVRTGPSRVIPVDTHLPLTNAPVVVDCRSERWSGRPRRAKRSHRSTNTLPLVRFCRAAPEVDSCEFEPEVKPNYTKLVRTDRIRPKCAGFAGQKAMDKKTTKVSDKRERESVLFCTFSPLIHCDLIKADIDGQKATNHTSRASAESVADE